jgi:hypothetical protein
MVEGADPGTIEKVRGAIEATMRERVREGSVALARAILLVRAEA